jgi:hypothetical protein
VRVVLSEPQHFSLAQLQLFHSNFEQLLRKRLVMPPEGFWLPASSLYHAICQSYQLSGNPGPEIRNGDWFGESLIIREI